MFCWSTNTKARRSLSKQRRKKSDTSSSRRFLLPRQEWEGEKVFSKSVYMPPCTFASSTLTWFCSLCNQSVSSISIPWRRDRFKFAFYLGIFGFINNLLPHGNEADATRFFYCDLEISSRRIRKSCHSILSSASPSSWARLTFHRWATTSLDDSSRWTSARHLAVLLTSISISYPVFTFLITF